MGTYAREVCRYNIHLKQCNNTDCMHLQELLKHFVMTTVSVASSDVTGGLLG